MGRKLSEGVGTPFQSGSSSWAMKSNSNGGFTNLKEPGILELQENNFPFEVSFLPNGKAIPEYVEGTDPFDYIASIKKVEGEPLFYMQARDQPDSPDLVTIGEIYLAEDMYTSNYGDTQFFFQHETLGRDIGRRKLMGDDRDNVSAWRAAAKAEDMYDVYGDIDPWYDNSDPPTFPEGMAAQEAVMGGLLGTLGKPELSGCPFAWMLLDQ